MQLLRKIWHTGSVTELLQVGDPAAVDSGRALEPRITRLFGRALAIREVDAGSCNGCELEMTGLTGRVYDMERFGMHFVASPRHADMLPVTGPVTRNMEVPLRRTRTTCEHRRSAAAHAYGTAIMNRGVRDHARSRLPGHTPA